MSRFKDEWNERFYQRYEEAREAGASEFEANEAAAEHADGLVNDYLSAADDLRKRNKENG